MYLLKTRKGSDKEMRYYLISILIHTILIGAFFMYFLNKNHENFEVKAIPVNIVAVSVVVENTSQDNQLPKELLAPQKNSENLKREENINSKNPTIVPKSQVKKSDSVEKKVSIERDLKIAQKSSDKIEIKDHATSSSEEKIHSGQSSNSSSDLINSSGGKIGANQNISGLIYETISSPEPQYPAQAKKIRLKEQVIIKTRFLVGLDGRVEAIEILSGTDRYGFRNEVQKTLKFWRFKPIFYKNENIKLYFYKDFTFQQK